MITLDDIKQALRWQHVRELPDGAFLVEVPKARMRDVHGLSSRQNTLYLNSDLLYDVPVCIRVLQDTTVFEYWTLNRSLHRERGPAHIIIDLKTGSYRRGWYKLGTKHREDGPAVEIGERLIVMDIDNGSVVKRDAVTMEWFHEGYAGNALGGPIKVELANVREHFIVEDGEKFLHGDDGNPGYSATNGRIVWINRDNASDIKILHPVEMRFGTLRRFYDSGNLLRTEITGLDTQWRLNNEITTIAEFDEWIANNALDGINLWDGPFWKSEGERLIAAVELDKLLCETPQT